MLSVSSFTKFYRFAVVMGGSPEEGVHSLYRYEEMRKGGKRKGGAKYRVKNHPILPVCIVDALKLIERF